MLKLNMQTKHTLYKQITKFTCLTHYRIVQILILKQPNQKSNQCINDRIHLTILPIHQLIKI